MANRPSQHTHPVQLHFGPSERVSINFLSSVIELRYLSSRADAVTKNFPNSLGVDDFM